MTHVVNLDDLPQDLASAAKTPNYVFITPDLCGDGHDATCSDSSRPGGFAGIEQFLQQWVPMITHSAAFKQQNGLLIITFDEAGDSDASSCCGEIAGPEACRCRARSPATGAATSARCCCRRASSRARSRRLRTTTTRCCAASRTSSASRTSATRSCRERRRSARTSSHKPCAFPGKPKIAATGHANKISVHWSASDAGGPGVAHYTLQARKGNGRWKTLLRSTTKRSTTYTGKAGGSYQFRVEFLDKLGKTSQFGTSKRISG